LPSSFVYSRAGVGLFCALYSLMALAVIVGAIVSLVIGIVKDEGKWITATILYTFFAGLLTVYAVRFGQRFRDMRVNEERNEEADLD
jgi:uncharacterized membrane protein